MEIWSAEKAREWYASTAWQVGMNYLPSTAVNSTEMWQKTTFDEGTIRRELRWAAKYGYNSVRVFLPFIVWENERDGFLDTWELFLQIAAENGLQVLPILFDDCAFDQGQDPVLGKQPDPIPGMHNARWTPSPGFCISDDSTKQSLLREYVHAVIGAHREDPRVVAWDLYNEPGNTKRGNLSLPLLVQSFRWARECEPLQPLTVGFWLHDHKDSVYHAVLELSDVISFHSYAKPEKTKAIAEELSALGKPIFITEWLCRQADNTIENHLPYFAEKKISCWHWGFVVGKTQTNLWWGRKDPAPEIWQHDVLFPDGTPYRPEELELIRQLRNIQ